MNFRASFCDPFKPKIIEIGNIEKEKIIETFEKIPWKELLNKMESSKSEEIYYSPSLEIENKDNKNGIVISAVDGREWYIFFKRPKLVKKLFGLIEKINENYTTEIQGQTEKDALDCLNALINNDLEFLERKIK
ncbi:MAG: hypothetical protein PHF25_09380 [Candidatus Margulisbacteria bacterium]|nr:hypothetical protein [Candidatus Margulisiibacteriota bacterium]